jgi:hypothetical protein
MERGTPRIVRLYRGGIRRIRSEWARAEGAGAGNSTAPASSSCPTAFHATINNIWRWAALGFCWKMAGSPTAGKISWRPTTPCMSGGDFIRQSGSSMSTIPAITAIVAQWLLPRCACTWSSDGAARQSGICFKQGWVADRGEATHAAGAARASFA